MTVNFCSAYGETAERVLAYLAKVARENGEAPRQMQIAADLGVSSVPSLIRALVKAGRLEMRAGTGQGRMRCYRLTESGLKTAGFDEAEDFTVADLVYERLCALADKGREMPGYTLFGQSLGLSDRAVYDAVQKLCRDGLIEARSLGGRSRRAFRIVATGRATAGFSRGVPILTPDMRRVVRKPEIEARKLAKERNCITCDRPFLSEGIHNRMCEPCRRGASSMDAASHRISLYPGRAR